MSETHEAMGFEATLPDGSMQKFTFKEVLSVYRSWDFPMPEEEQTKVITWLQSDNLNRIFVWLSVKQWRSENPAS